MLSINELSKLAENINVLYVEDEEDTRKSVSCVLENIFDSILIANDGQEGIEIAKNYKIDLIISDINMPKCNGLDMIRKIKEIYPQVPTILVTALENPEILIQSIDLGINKYIIKPMEKDKLFVAIEEMLYFITARNKYKEKQLTISQNFKMIAISKLLDNLTHQWRQSLSIISASSSGIQMQEDKQINDSDIQNLLQNINNTVTSMDKELQNVLLSFEQEHQKVHFHLSKVITEVIELFKIQCYEANITIVNDIEDIEVFNSYDSYSQVLYHILENSIDALILSNVNNKYIRLFSSVDDENIIIDIIDNGGGIKETIKDEIFEPYTTTKHQYIGTGLGLYIAYILTTKSLNGIIRGDNIIIDSKECAKFSLIISNK